MSRSMCPWNANPLCVFYFLLSGNMEEIMILGSQVIALEVCMCGSEVSF